MVCCCKLWPDGLVFNTVFLEKRQFFIGKKVLVLSQLMLTLIGFSPKVTDRQVEWNHAQFSCHKLHRFPLKFFQIQKVIFCLLKKEPFRCRRLWGTVSQVWVQGDRSRSMWVNFENWVKTSLCHTIKGKPLTNGNQALGLLSFSFIYTQENMMES